MFHLSILKLATRKKVNGYSWVHCYFDIYLSDSEVTLMFPVKSLGSFFFTLITHNVIKTECRKSTHSFKISINAQKLFVQDSHFNWCVSNNFFLEEKNTNIVGTFLSHYCGNGKHLKIILNSTTICVKS